MQIKEFSDILKKTGNYQSSVFEFTPDEMLSEFILLTDGFGQIGNSHIPEHNKVANEVSQFSGFERLLGFASENNAFVVEHGEQFGLMFEENFPFHGCSRSPEEINEDWLDFFSKWGLNESAFDSEDLSYNWVYDQIIEYFSALNKLAPVKLVMTDGEYTINHQIGLYIFLPESEVNNSNIDIVKMYLHGNVKDALVKKIILNADKPEVGRDSDKDIGL